MPNISGMELAKAIRTHDQDAYILFVTSYLNYSIEGYELGIFRYIPKNLLEEKIVEALDTFTKEIRLKNERNYIIRTNSRYEKVLYKNITFIYKSGKNAVFVCENNESKVRKSLKKVYEELDSSEFMFIERGYIVNINQIEKIINGEVFMKNSEILHIGRSFQKEVKIKLADFWSERL
ncbi:LytR/AlgR family response regulator transcription factor [Enterococcus rotai]|uniref:LytR/AlgR family response regulator transcription factor n=1 Tax=Enterococcus rotai TaxID=118060 RepID=UPI0035C729FE